MFIIAEITQLVKGWEPCELFSFSKNQPQYCGFCEYYVQFNYGLIIAKNQ